MQALTERELKEFAPRARDDYVEALVKGWPELQRAGFNTPLRLCEFLAQVAHETGGFSILRENTSWTPAQMKRLWPSRFPMGAADPRIIACGRDDVKLANLAYSGRADLGNRGGNDGWNYRGCNFLQHTGRSSFRVAGLDVGLDLENNPEVLEKPTIGLRCAIAWWVKSDLHRFADWHYTRAIGNAINRGNPYSSYSPIGHEDRDSSGRLVGGRVWWFNRAWQLFGDGAAPSVPQGIALGAQGAKVEQVQMLLRDRNYGTGAIDGVFGPATAKAVVAFKFDHKRRTGQELEPDEIVGPKTEAALEHAEVAEVSPERAEATAKDLAAAGSTEIKTGQNIQAAGTTLVAAGGVKAAGEAGMFDAAQQQLSWIPTAHSFLAPTIDAISWGFKHVFWVVAIVGGVWVWTRGKDTIKSRLKAHNLGFNLFR